MLGKTVVKKYWRDVREDVQKLNPKLAGLIDDISPGDEYFFYHVKVPYGFQFLKNGLFYLPSETGEGVALNSSQMPKQIKDDLGYNLYSNPVTFVLEKSLELFTNFDNQIIPFNLFYPGDIFGLSWILDLPTNYNPSHVEASSWDMTAGVRSTFLLPKVSQLGCHKRLQKYYGVINDQPKSLSEHWDIFRQIHAGAVSFNRYPEWISETLLFSKDWFQTIDDPAWQSLWVYFYQSNRSRNAFWRNSFSWDLNFSKIQRRKNIRPTSSGVTETVKSLFAMATGAVPAFQPAKDDLCLPNTLIQDAYVNAYGLKEYAPLVMQPCYFGVRDKNSAYYSLQYPVYDTTYKVNNKSSSISSMSVLDEIHRILVRHIDELSVGKLKDEITPLHEVQNKVNFRMFHTVSTETANDVNLSADLPKFDKNFNITNYPNNTKFPESAIFFRGCLQLSFK